MGALAAAVTKKERPAAPIVVTMLKELTHRGADNHGVATADSLMIAESLEEMDPEKLDSEISLGHNFSRFSSRDRPQPVLGDDFALVFEGRLYPPPKLSEVDKVAEMLQTGPPSPCARQREADAIVKRLDGSYAFAIACADTLIAGRDSLGVTPLYYGENEKTFALASERKALWSVGVEDTRSFPPGNIAVFTGHGVSFKSLKPLTQPPLEAVDMETAAARLESILLRSTKKRVSGFAKLAVAFSGGIDSSTIAVLADKCGVEVHLFTVGLENQPEIQFAKAAAEALGLPLHIQAYTVKDIESVLSKILWLIEDPSVMKVGVALPLFWVAQNSSRRGFKVLLTGLGGDELFGGYHKYLRKYKGHGAIVLRNVLFRDIEMSHKINLQRDDKVCAFHKMELRLPFMDQTVVDFALGLPVDLNITSEEDPLRKRVLRQTAHRLGIPTFIVNKAKRAIQYATGVNKALRRIAKEKRLGLQDYVEETFSKIYPEAKYSG
jgi:asparagine synthase (glutamine-hydrolysing)